MFEYAVLKILFWIHRNVHLYESFSYVVSGSNKQDRDGQEFLPIAGIQKILFI